MLTQEQVEAFRRDGYLNGGLALDDDEVEGLRTELMRVIEQKDDPAVAQPVLLRNLSGSEDAPVWQVVNIWMASAPFRAAMEKQKIVEDVAQLTGARELRLWHDQIQYKPATRGGVNMWHQDSPYWPIIKPNTQVTAWIALDDVDEDNGCMSMVPGSHRWGDQVKFLHTLANYDAMPASFDGHPLAVIRRPVRKGHVHYHHGLTWHGSHANKSGRPRRAIAYHYMTDETYYDANGNHVMKSFVEVADGERLTGSAFPLVWSRAKAVC